ncbi:MAG: hypothetical protein GF329_06745 [Candidatus Lokiarchaeota archaeon]|nr:hypothetical protein [Candidatus Lokiarchaeota archaeon]
MTNVKKFSCTKCGSTFNAYPPDDAHTIATRNEDDANDPIRIEYECKECGYSNVIFWSKHSGPVMAVGSD